MKVSERRVCRVLGQHRSTQRRAPQGRDDEDRLVADMIELTRQYGRYGYRRVAALLRDAGWPPLRRLLCNRLPGSGNTRLLLTSANQFHKCLAMQELSTQDIPTFLETHVAK